MTKSNVKKCSCSCLKNLENLFTDWKKNCDDHLSELEKNSPDDPLDPVQADILAFTIARDIYQECIEAVKNEKE